MFEVREVFSPGDKRRITENILRSLPEWFGIEESLVEYVKKSEALPFFAAYDGDMPFGFVFLLKHGEFAREICCMGILREYHRKGVGRALVGACVKRCEEENVTYLTVKTLADTHPDPGYALTRKFYRAAGFVPLEVFPDLWGEENPCLLMVKYLA